MLERGETGDHWLKMLLLLASGLGLWLVADMSTEPARRSISEKSKNPGPSGRNVSEGLPIATLCRRRQMEFDRSFSSPTLLTACSGSPPLWGMVERGLGDNAADLAHRLKSFVVVAERSGSAQGRGQMIKHQERHRGHAASMYLAHAAINSRRSSRKSVRR